MKKIRGWDKDRIDRRVLNKVGLHQGGKPVYPSFLPSDHILPQDQDAFPNWSIIVGLDFGRQPAAAFCQCINGSWYVLSELIGDNESASLFAPRVAQHLGQEYPGLSFECFGDPRGADKGQNDESTAYDIFAQHGLNVIPATTDNNVEMRRSTVNTVLSRRNGLHVNPSCTTLKTGMAGGYHYKKMQGVVGMFSPNPVKNIYSHIVEALENALMGGGEGSAIISRSATRRLAPSPVTRSSIRGRM